MLPLTPERWREVSPFLDQALSFENDERESWLNKLQSENPDLAELLRALLQEQCLLQEDNFLGVTPETPSDQPSLTGRAIGAYHLLSPLGQGGMGTVWLAERSDGRFERRVAIKFLRFSLAATGGTERFKREGRILGQLDHPHIAELIDAGITEQGEPFLVLEHVEGDPIDEYCDRHKLDVVARILLFHDVLRAVGHAHARLIVHRDLKPSNVLVTRDGRVKLLDFGIAKLLGDETGSSEATLLTLEGGAALTPQFAAPEQITGAPVTTATDVYALGVLLYLLLTGRNPAGASTRSAAELVKAIVETEPGRASDAVDSSSDPSSVAVGRSTTPERLARQLRGDLDTIIGKALKKNPAERYSSVAAFGDDLQHYRKHETITARPDSFSYRANRFIRRNRLALGLTTLAVAAVIAGATAILIQAHSARAQRDFAFRQLRRAQKINDLNHFLLTDAPSGSSLSPDALLERAERVVQHENYSSDPAHHVEMLVSIGTQYVDKTQYDKALPILEDAYQLSRKISDLSARAEAACALALPLYRNSQYERAEALIQDGLSQLPSDPQFALDRVACLANGAKVSYWSDRDELSQQRELAAKEIADASPFATDYLKFNLHRFLALQYQASGDLAKSIASYEEAAAFLKKLGYDGTETEADLQGDLGGSLLSAGRVLEAAKVFRYALHIVNSQTPGFYNPVLMNEYATTLLWQGHPREALSFATGGYEIGKGKDNLIADQSILIEARIYLREGNLRKAATTLAEAEALIRRDYPSGAFQVEMVQNTKALLMDAQGNPAGALKVINEIMERLDSARDHQKALDIFLLPRILMSRSEIELRLNNSNAAQVDAERALKILSRQTTGEGFSYYVGKAEMALGKSLMAQARRDEARDAFHAAVTHFDHTLGAESPDSQDARKMAAQ